MEQGLPLISGFSKLDRTERIKILDKILKHGVDLKPWLDAWMHPAETEQAKFQRLSENYITSFHIPFGVVPNMVINGIHYIVPMVIEESSVIAAASRSAKFWSAHGGFKAEVVGTERKGQVHFIWTGDGQWLSTIFYDLTGKMMAAIEPVTRKMRERGGGISKLRLLDKTEFIDGYYQLDVSFETADAMGANFINTCLEEMAETLRQELDNYRNQGSAEIIMSILSNYTPQSLIRCTVECRVSELAGISGHLSPDEYARKFALAARMAQIDVSRAVTHNKGIYNGVDAVVLATGNDWRAVEACGHAYASADGTYRSLTHAEISGSHFKYTLELPIALGTIGGLTKTHPQAALALEILGNPGASDLMMVAAAAGMANNFSAVTALITSGIQKGHMKMHLPNLLKQLNATPEEENAAFSHFAGNTVSHAAVETFIHQWREKNDGTNRY
jgi:hydroxymethylglutaryl-CoA reductase